MAAVHPLNHDDNAVVVAMAMRSLESSCRAAVLSPGSAVTL